MIGIKGSGMSALAQILHDNDFSVTGSDIDKHFFTQVPLEQRNIPMFSFSKDNIQKEHTIVSSSAFNKDNNEEIDFCEKNNIPYLYYHQFLGKLIESYTSIAISGTHGKTSTTSLTSHIFQHQKPISSLIGDGTGFGVSNSEYFIFESCEYQDHFLHYHPDYSIITNIDFDHSDYFKDIHDVIDSFQGFVNQTKKGVIICGEDEHTSQLTFQPHQTVITYGFQPTHTLYADKESIRIENGTQSFEVFYQGESLGRFAIRQFGDHSILNTLAMLGVSLLNNLNIEHIQKDLLTFLGAKRRFNEEYIDDIVVVDDYAHHPTEIAVTIQAAKSKYPTKKVVAVFQSHTYSRTISLLEEFKGALTQADEFHVFPVFSSAREQKQEFELSSFIENMPNGFLTDEHQLDTFVPYEDTVFLFMGAGNINQHMNTFKTLLKQK